MNDPTPTPSPSNPDRKRSGSVDDDPDLAEFDRQRRPWFWGRLWLVPVVTLTLAMCAAVGHILRVPPTFVSTCRLWETAQLRLPESAFFTEDPQSYFGTQSELLKSERLRHMAQGRLQNANTNAVPKDNEGNPLKIKLKVTQAPKSSIILAEASGSDRVYTRSFLDALVNEFIAYKKNVRLEVSGDTLASVSEQVQRLERDMKADQDVLSAFQRTNNLALLQAQGTAAVECLAKLYNLLSDLQLEDMLLNNFSPSPTDSVPRQTVQLKMAHVRDSIKEWETKVVDNSARSAEADRLKLNIARSQSFFDRLVNLLNNIDLSRNIQQSTLAILEPASPAQRSYAYEMRLLAIAGFGGLGLGLGIVGLMVLSRGRKRRALEPDSRLGRPAIEPSAAERLEQVKVLHEKSLLSKEAYDRKVEQILDSL